jgi:hypothetical protein
MPASDGLPGESREGVVALTGAGIGVGETVHAVTAAAASVADTILPIIEPW